MELSENIRIKFGNSKYIIRKNITMKFGFDKMKYNDKIRVGNDAFGPSDKELEFNKIRFFIR